jgi:type III restriction enzyme
MFELNERYGFCKFIVVVPSIAIREGVFKTFNDTAEHFHHIYKQKARFFVYNSSNLHQLDEFSQNSGINVMIINMQAFNTSLKEGGTSKESRIIYTKQDSFQSRRPIDVIAANHPIIIQDEPQKMQGDKTQNALKNHFKPLFSLNYSATHAVRHDLVYVLDALDAYKKKLVKKIEVKGFELHRLSGTDGYIYFSEIILDKHKAPRARLQIDKKLKGGDRKRVTSPFDVGDNLYVESGELESYKGLFITDINTFDGTITFSSGDVLGVSEANCENLDNHIRRMQIRETIESHFEKEERLFADGIKCLSLFFIDEVAKYRQYDDEGNQKLGEYGVIFEEEYNAVLAEKITLEETPYISYLKRIATKDTHQGYFSIDKNKREINSKVTRGNDFSDDISAYDKILKHKEILLSFTDDTRFIFSHSALREGWDNPNIFQICTLKQSDNTTAKRQEVGRGLRLCVNQAGDRQDAETLGNELVQDVNKLTVIASSSYNDFVGTLQSDIKDYLYERPKKADKEYFAGKMVKANGETVVITEKQATAAYNYLVRNDYVDDDGKVTDNYRDAVKVILTCCLNILPLTPDRMTGRKQLKFRICRGSPAGTIVCPAVFSSYNAKSLV